MDEAPRARVSAPSPSALLAATHSVSSRRGFSSMLLGGLGLAAVVASRLLRRDSDDEDGPGGQSRVANPRPLPPYRAPEFAGGKPALSFVALGDTGWTGPILDGLVAEMERDAGALPISFVCLLGDNFYPDGVTSALDPRFETDFERRFPEELLAVPFRVALGNHDHHGNPE